MGRLGYAEPSHFKKMVASQSSYRTNERIRAPQVRVIDENGQQLGVMPTAEALNTAKSRGVDLVEVAPFAQPPVVRIIDYKRWLFQREKQKEGRKESKTELKELRIRPNIGENDLRLRVRRAEGFLRAGDKVKLAVIYRGREITHPEIGLQKIKTVSELLREVGKPEKDPERFERGYEVTFIPVRNA